MEHYTKEELELYRNRKMSVFGRIVCSAHLKKCPECAALLVELSQDDVFLEQIREALRERPCDPSRK